MFGRQQVSLAEDTLVYPTNHFKDQCLDYFNQEVTWQQAMAIINSKMKHRKRGEHWVLVKRLQYDMFVERRSTADGHINGDVLIAVVRYNTDISRWVATTIFVRRERQRKKCKYYWA